MRWNTWENGVVLAVAVGVFALAGQVLGQGTDPLIGTWKLNVAKSTYSPGPVPKSSTLKYEAAGSGIKVSVDGVAADGSTGKWGFTANYDGKDVPITGNNPYAADMATMKRVNPTTTETTYKKGGKVTTTNVRVISADGKTLTITTTGTDTQGRAVKNVAVYEKQSSGTD